jgi:uncharacterized membrane protein HdeD (DUF308 family)
MLELLSRYWWTILLRGLAAIAFGLIAWLKPGISLAFLVLLFGAYVFVDGVFSLIATFSGRHQVENRWLTGLIGVLGILFGVLTFISPAAATLALLLYIAAWSLATGVLQIVAAIRLRNEIKGEFWLGLVGLLSIVFAVLVLASPAAGALAVIWLIAAYAIALGIALVMLSFRLRAQRPADTAPKPSTAASR